ncbi:MAG: bifunctional anthranilate synthase component II/anthranilate phosphoribosyltransferase [Oscillospiraceae bacterium]|nr:bifunctional anthranilate synthase component II/anthranilate phosphoribosyltransferase [Oscillospiraceae bacterium]
MILMIDNYDSFTYNVYQVTAALYNDIKVYRNDEITTDEIEKMDLQGIIISPGPSTPSQAGITKEVISRFAGKIPIFGICLGHEAIGEVFGGKVVRAPEPFHGKTSMVTVDNKCGLFRGMPERIAAARYHSLIVESESLPDVLEVTARTDDGLIMGVRHKEYEVYGVQFHPESVLAEFGVNILANFLQEICGIKTTFTAPEVPMEKRTALKKYIAKAAEGEHLTRDEAQEAIDIIMSDLATPAQTAALLTAMRMNVETIDEITGCALAMRGKMTTVPHKGEVLEIVGTGGDLANSFNISTTSAFVISACGQKVAKHGNRSVSSKSGAADVLEALGVKIATTPEQAAECIEEVGFTFLFAQSYHKAMRYVGPVRAQSGIRTVFNILGPLANPANAEYNVIGVYEERLLDIVANVLKNLAVKHSLVIFGTDKLDEFSISAETMVREIKDGEILSYTVSPEDFGLARYNKIDITGGDAQENAKITLGILKGEITGAKRDIVLLNAGAALYAGCRAKSIAEGVEMAREAIDSGRALEQVNKLVAFTNK